MKEQVVKPASCNAFELISLLKGLDFSGFFENQQVYMEWLIVFARFFLVFLILVSTETEVWGGCQPLCLRIYTKKRIYVFLELGL